MRLHNPQITGSLSVSGSVGNESYIIGTNVGIGITNPTAVLEVAGANALLLSTVTNDAATPTLAFGDGDTGFYESADDTIQISIAGNNLFQINSSIFQSNDTSGPGLLTETATSTNPTLIPANNDYNTGIGWSSADKLSLVAGGVSILELTGAAGKEQISGSSTSTGSFGEIHVADKVGIGTTDPTSPLHILKEATATTSPIEVLKLEVREITAADLGPDMGPALNFYVPDDKDNSYGSPVGSQLGGQIAQLRHSVTDVDGGSRMTFSTADDNAALVKHMVIDQEGRVGIGTTGPDELLHLFSSTSNKPVLKIENTNADASPPVILIGKDSSSPADADEVGGIQFFGDDDGGNVTVFADIFGASVDVSNGSEDGSILFRTMAGGSMSSTIIKSGNVGMGGTTSPGAPLEIMKANGVALQFSYENTQDWLHRIDTEYSGTAASNYLAFDICSGDGSIVSDVLKLSGDKSAAFAGDVTIDGSLVATEFHTEFISASVVYSSGSNTFGDDGADKHLFTGSLQLSGSTTNPSYIIGTKVGIGDTAPNGILHVAEANDGGETQLWLINSAGEGSSDETAAIRFGTTADATPQNMGKIIAGRQGAYSSGAARDSFLKFYVAYNDAETLAIHIDGARGGNVAIGGEGDPEFPLAIANGKVLGWHSTSGDSNSRSWGFANDSAAYGDFVLLRSDGQDNILDTPVLSFLKDSSATFRGNVSSSAASTGSFGTLKGSNFDISTGKNVIIGKGAGANVDAGSINNVFIGSISGDASLSTALENTGVGAGTLTTLTSGDYNTAIGSQALEALTTGANNTAVGTYALITLTTASHNVALGRKAGYDATTASGSVFIGAEAGENTTTGNMNIAVGYQALRSGGSVTGDNNIAIGAFAGDAITSGYRNVLLGQDAGGAVTTGYDLILLGKDAGATITSTREAVLIGAHAGDAINSTDSSGTIAIGFNALTSQTSGYANTSVGYKSLEDNTVGDYNTAIGHGALQEYKVSTDGAGSNTAVGAAAGGQATTASGSVFVGKDAGLNLTTGNQNIAIGLSTMVTAVTGDNNIAIGAFAGDALTSGWGNIFMGKDAGGAFTTAYSNIAIGYEALDAEADAHYNVAIGNYALTTQNASAGGSGNVAVGYQAGLSLTTGQSSTFIGHQTAAEGAGNAITGLYNTAVGAIAGYALEGAAASVTLIGYAAGTAITTGADNTIVGSTAGDAITTGGGNVCIGMNAGGNFDAEDGNVAIGRSAFSGATSAAYCVSIGMTTMQGAATSNGTIAIGYNALNPLTSGAGNIAIGYQAADALTTGQKNVAIGYTALSAGTGNSYNIAIGYEAMLVANGADDSVVIGYQAGKAISTGDSNVIVGTGTGIALTTGNKNVMVGVYTGDAATTASGSVFLGYDAGGTVTTGYGNIAVGHDAMNGAATTGPNNIAIGVSAGDALTSGYDNILMGNDAGGVMTTGLGSVLIGVRAGEAITDPTGTIAIGYKALLEEDNADYTVAIGAFALTKQNAGTNWSDNIAIGPNAGYWNVTGLGNTWVGAEAGVGASGQSNSDNTGVGRDAMSVITTGVKNSVVGSGAGAAVTTASGSAFLGYSAGNGVTTGNWNIAIGRGSMNTGGTTGDNNIAIGASAGDALTSGKENILIGPNAGGAMNTGNNNLVIGASSAGGAITSGAYNVILGNDAGIALDDGGANIIIGQGSGYYTTSVNNAVIIGREACAGGNMTTAANFTVGVGREALRALTSGPGNVAVGHYAGGKITTGAENVAFGSGSLKENVDGSYNTAIGNLALETFEADSANHGENTAVGWKAAANLSTATNIVAIGAKAMGTGTVTGDSNVAVGYNAGAALGSGHNNVIMGTNAAKLLTTGQRNIAIGTNALDAANGGEDYNIAIGDGALGALDGANQNVALGCFAGETATSVTNAVIVGTSACGNGVMTSAATGTVAVGHSALRVLTSGAGNLAVGYGALQACTTGLKNVAIGSGSLATDVSGNYSTAVGNQALHKQNLDAEIGNTAVGYKAGFATTTGTYNVLVGMATGDQLTTASGSTFIGTEAGGGSTTGNRNIGIGIYALGGALTGDNNIAIGSQAGDALTSGAGNVLMGKDAGGAITTGGHNVCVGLGAGTAIIGAGENTIVGSEAGDHLTTGANNVAIGRSALGLSTAGLKLVAIGQGALADGVVETGAEGAVGIGMHALLNLSSGAGNTAVGYEALLLTTTGNYNTAVGWHAADALVAGSDGNTAIGYNALTAGNNDSTHYNTAIGYNAADALTIGANNTFIGANVAGTAVNNVECVVIGVSAQVSANGTGNEIVIGQGANGVGENYAVIGNENVTRVYASEDAGATFYGAGQSWSDKRIKENVKDIGLGLDFINKINPIQYTKKQPKDYEDSLKSKIYPEDSKRTVRSIEDVELNRIRPGFIAQDVLEVLEELDFSSNNSIVQIDEKTTEQSMDYAGMVVPLVKAVQELSAKVEEQQKEIEELKNK